MKSFILGIGLVLVVAMSLGCDENNNVIAQEPGLMEPEPMDPGPSATSNDYGYRKDNSLW